MLKSIELRDGDIQIITKCEYGRLNRLRLCRHYHSWRFNWLFQSRQYYIIGGWTRFWKCCRFCCSIQQHSNAFSR
ncbi:AP2/ERF and B3 domain-containing transcription factor [Dirofilaria immitis]